MLKNIIWQTHKPIEEFIIYARKHKVKIPAWSSFSPSLENKETVMLVGEEIFQCFVLPIEPDELVEKIKVFSMLDTLILLKGKE